MLLLVGWCMGVRGRGSEALRFATSPRPLTPTHQRGRCDHQVHRASEGTVRRCSGDVAKRSASEPGQRRTAPLRIQHLEGN